MVERTVGQVIKQYEDSLTNFVYETLNGKMDKLDLARAHRALMRELAPQVYVEGLREGGVPVEEMDEADRAAVQEWLGTQLAYVRDFAASAYEAGLVGAAEGARDAVLRRLDWWVESMRALGNKGVMSAADNLMVTWRLNAVKGTKKHCPTCLNLNNKRHRMRWFLSKGYVPREPGSETLKCGGWDCGCGLVDDKGSVRV